MENENIQKGFYDKAFEKRHVWKDTDFPEENKFFYRRFLERAFKNNAQNVLEIGSGNGLLTFFLLKKPVRITAVDVSDRAIDNMSVQFREEIASGKLKLVTDDLINFLEKTEERFDLIIGSGIIHHIEKKDWDRLYELAYQKLNPGGIFSCAPEPNGGWIFKFFWRLASYVYKIFGIKYDWEVEKGTLDMIPGDLEASLKKAGFEYAQVLPFQVLPHFHLKSITRFDQKIVDSVKKRFSLYIIIEAQKMRQISHLLSSDGSKHSPHNIIPRLIKKENPLVLDLGCNTGNVGRKIIQLKNATVDGVDLNSDALKIAKQSYRQVFEVDLSQKNFVINQEKYDYIIMADILEHLYNPATVLRNIRQYLKDNGTLIISLPNIARMEIRLNLLFGNFDYKPGILADDHLRFFTRKSAQKMIEECGYRVIRAIPTGLGHMIGMFPTLTAFQFIYICKKL